ncbi:DUF6056 family protein [Clostridium sp. SHJSY1]|uniref:DUF3329 domain-containing protein n=1 Tax=Clostridium sp. SHJSY1 TaxID=2942483 RepID=UPI002874703B|nr:DUF6056 family protein [Clostridium sp. SHJSY1]MDS0525877.1 DUF6056 family protein [Clostridium sp. SHJSY1]
MDNLKTERDYKKIQNKDKRINLNSKGIQKKDMHINFNAILNIIIMLSVFILMLILNSNTEYTSDDYRYHFFYDSYMPNEYTHELKGVFEIFSSMWNHYNLWGGRIVAHSIVQFFMLFDKSLFNVINSFIYVILGGLIYYHIEPNLSKWKALYLGGIYMVMWIFIPEFGLSILWISGACNYLWMTVGILLFLIPFRHYEYSKNRNKNKFVKALIIIPFGILVGCTNENSGGAMILLVCFYIIYWYIKKIKVPLWSITGIISACIGFGFLIVAPGNGKRGQVVIGLEALKQQLDLLLKVFYDNNIILFIPLIVFTTMYIVQNNLSIKESAKKLIFPSMYLIAGVASVVVLIVSPTVSGRSWIWEVCYLTIAIGNIMVKLSFKHWILRFERILLFVCMSIICINTFGEAHADIKKTDLQIVNEINQINEQKKQGIRDVVVTRFDDTTNKYSAFNGSANLAERDCWFNCWMAKYYDVNSISVEVIE